METYIRLNSRTGTWHRHNVEKRRDEIDEIDEIDGEDEELNVNKGRKRIANGNKLASGSPAAEERPGPIDRGCPHSKGFAHGEFRSHKYGPVQSTEYSILYVYKYSVANYNR